MITIKRIVCFILLCSLLSLNIFAVEIDGNIYAHAEYADNGLYLQTEKNISNNDVGYVFLRWLNDPENYSLYLAIQYSTNDFIVDGGESAVEVTINDQLCTTFYPDSTMDEVDQNFFNVESKFVIQEALPSHIRGEMRIGIKYGFTRDITVGIRVFDCSGVPSNYYTYTVYPQSPSQNEPETTTVTIATTCTTCTTEKTDTSTAPSTTEHTQPRTTKPLITAAVCTTAAAVTTAAVSAEMNASTAAHTSRTHSPETTTKKSKKKAEKKEASTHDETSELSQSQTESETELTTLILPESVHGYGAYRVKTVGIAFSAALVTAAVMIFVFLTINGKHRKHEITAEEQNEDFG